MIFIKARSSMTLDQIEQSFYPSDARMHGCTHATAPECPCTQIKEGNKRNRVNGLCKRADRIEKYLRHGESRRQTTGSYMYMRIAFSLRERGRFSLRPFPRYRTFNPCKKCKGLRRFAQVTHPRIVSSFKFRCRCLLQAACQKQKNPSFCLYILKIIAD